MRLLGLIRDPLVDLLASCLRLMREVHDASSAGAIVLRQRLEELRRERMVGSRPQRVRKPQFVTAR